MKNQGLFTSIAAATILLGGVLPAALGRSAANRAEAAAQPRPPAPPATASASQADEADALDTIAESLGLDVSARGLKDTIRQDVAWLGRGDDTGMPEQAAAVARERRQTAIDRLHAFLSLPIRENAPGLTDARAALTQLSESLNTETPRRAALAKLERFVKAYFDDDALRVANASADARLLATDFDTIDRSALKRAVLRRAAEEQHIAVRFLIATLPDPVDSFTGWQFDPMLDAVAQAVAASDYVLDRFHFPDSDFEGTQPGSTPARSERAHDSTPGVIVFRSHVQEDISLDIRQGTGLPADSRSQRNVGSDRLVLLIVHENPSGGVHVPALTGAIRLILDWTDPEKVVRILGPTFSGSSDSIARTLRELEPELPPGYWFRIVSGSATNPATRSTLDELIPQRVQFHSTVNADDVLFQTLFKHLNDIGWPKPIAVLFESNTLYGRGMVEQIVDHQQLIDRQQLVLLPFPMNISRLRSSTPATTPEANDALRLPSRFRPLSLQDVERGNPVDRLPQFFPDTASNYQELALSSTLQAIAQEHIRTVALMATDPRDKLFLAQQLARYAPDVSIVTPESDSLYVHPDYSSYLRGALVVSTYPLDPGNQRRSYGFEGGTTRRQFANGSAQGIYNATVILLNYDEAGAYHYPEGVPRHLPAKLVEYGPPLKECNPCAPPVWISVIGPNGAAPVRAYDVPVKPFHCSNPVGSAPAAKGNCESEAYVLPILSAVDPEAQDVALAGSGATLTFPSLSFRIVFVSLGVLVLATLGAFVMAGRRSGTWLSNPPLNRYSGGYLLVAFGSVLLIATFVVSTLVVRLRAEPSRLTLVAFVAALVAIAALLELSRRATIQFVKGPGAKARRPPGVTPVRWMGIPLAVLGAFAVVNLLRYEWRQVAQPPSDSINFVTRAVDLASGVSPTLPVACLAVGVVLWALSEFARSRTPCIALTDESVRPLLKHAVRGDIGVLTRTSRLLNGSLLSVPAALLAAVLVTILAVALFAFDPIALPLVTIEGPAFGRFLSAALLAFQLLIGLALCQFIYVWLSLKTLLRSMAHHELSGAYGRVRRALRPVGFFPRIPELQTLHPVVTRWQRYSNANPADRFGMRPGPNIMEVFEQEMREKPKTPWSTSHTWKTMMKDIRLLAGERIAMPAELGPSSFGLTTNDAGSLPRELDDIVAISVALVIRDAIARLWHNLVFVAGAVSLVFASHTFFPVQPQKTLAGIAWVYVCTTFAAILTVLVQMKRDHVLARLMCVPSDQRRWDADVILKFAIFGALPLLTLFATQFPDAGSVLLRWLEPVQKALP